MWLLIYGREKAKLVVVSKHFFVLQQCKNKVHFESNSSGIVLKFSLHFLKGGKCCPMNRKDC